MHIMLSVSDGFTLWSTRLVVTRVINETILCKRSRIHRLIDSLVVEWWIYRLIDSLVVEWWIYRLIDSLVVEWWIYRLFDSLVVVMDLPPHR